MKVYIIYLIFPLLFSSIQPNIDENIKRIDKDISFYKEVVLKESNWLSNLVLSNGAIILRPSNEMNIIPYFSNFAAIALIETNDRKNISQAKKYIIWYVNHLNSEDKDYNNIAGSIYDYKIIKKNNKLIETSQFSYDSIDSYAASFFILLNKYFEKTNDKSFILKNDLEIKLIENALLKSIKSNGLSMAKPDYPVYYLMDNCEVYKGLKSLEKLYLNLYLKDNFLLNLPDYLKIIYLKSQIKNNILDMFWSNKYNGFFYAYNKDSINFERFYPDGVAQLYPVIFEVLSPNSLKAKKIYNRFNQTFEWETFRFLNKENYYWGIFAYTSIIFDDYEKNKIYLKNYLKITNTTYDFPAINFDSSWVVRSSILAIEKLKFKKKVLNFFNYYLKN
ncbi:MAG: hypothetical protein ACQEQE_04685 [Bacillota bacterium]